MTDDTYAADAYGNAFRIDGEQLQRQQEGAAMVRQLQEQTARDTADFDKFCQVVAQHFGITSQQVKSTWSVAHECWQALRYEAAQRKTEAARSRTAAILVAEK